MAPNAQQVAGPGTENDLRSVTDSRAMTVAMILFFMVGFLTCLNDIIIPHLKSVFEFGPLTSKGSSLMIASIVGGALIPLGTGRLADRVGLQPSFIVTVICYAYIAAFGAVAIRRPVLIQVPPEIPPG